MGLGCMSGSIVWLVFAIFSLILLFNVVKVVSQSQEYIVERFGKYRRTLKAGLNFVVPFFDTVQYQVSVLERPLEDFKVNVITRDNVEVDLKTTVFYRIVDSARMVYRISDAQRSIKTMAESVIRSSAGGFELDDLQTSREVMGEAIKKELIEATEVWGIEITRTEIMDISLDEQTKEAQRQQLNAERERRANIAIAEGNKTKMELEADAEYYQSQKKADAVRLEADAQAYAIEKVAQAIRDSGQSAVQFEVAKKQVQAIAELASSSNTKTLVVPTDITESLGSLFSVLDLVKGQKV